MTEAIFGLVGVVIGGLLNGGVSFLTERARSRGNAKAAARIVVTEAVFNEVVLEVAENGKTFPEAELKLDAWWRHRDALAAVLSDKDWSHLANHYTLLEQFLVEVDTGQDLSGSNLKNLNMVKRTCKPAIEAARSHAGKFVTYDF